MRNTDAQPIIARLLDHAERGVSWKTERLDVSARDYYDPAVLASEQSTIFRRLPQAMAISSDVPEPGSYVTRDMFAVPLVIIRGDDGVARGFANVCAHRGSQVVPDGRGSGRRFACPYHAWSYDRGGELVAVPDREAFPDVCVPGAGLRELPTSEHHGVIWVAPPGGDAPDTIELGPIGVDLDHYGLDEYTYWRSHRFELDLNWKLVIDTFLEGYHFSSLHRKTVGKFFLPNLAFAERVGLHTREILPRKSLLELAGQPPDTWDLVPHSAIVYQLFPSTIVVMQIDHIETWRVFPNPTDPATSLVELDFFIPADGTRAGEHWEKNWKVTIDTVIDEDFAAMATVQRGLASGVLDTARVGANEPALAMFHQAYAEAMAGVA